MAKDQTANLKQGLLLLVPLAQLRCVLRQLHLSSGIGLCCRLRRLLLLLLLHASRFRSLLLRLLLLDRLLLLLPSTDSNWRRVFDEVLLR